MINGENFFDQPVKNNLRTFDIIQENTISQEGGYTTGSLLDYLYFKENYELVAIDLSKQKQYNKLILLGI